MRESSSLPSPSPTPQRMPRITWGACDMDSMPPASAILDRSEEHTSELQSPCNLVCRHLLEKTKMSSGSGCLLCARARCAAGETLMLGAVCRPVMARPPSLHHSDSATPVWLYFFCVIDAATTEIYTLSLHDALPI